MILFITPYPKGTAASQRFRFEQYYQALDKEGIKYDVSPFWEEKAWDLLYLKGYTFSKIFYVFKGFVRRWLLVVKCFKFDYLFVHREIYPTGIRFLIFILGKVLKRKIIYDFDDAIWLPNYADNNKRFAFLKSYSQVKSLCKHAYKVSVGNDYLKDYALQYNHNVVVNPTTIDTVNLHNQSIRYDAQHIVLGWTGTHSTLKYLLDLIPIFDSLIQKYSFKLHVISDLPLDVDRGYLTFIPWSKKTEIQDLMSFNLGLMPLTDDQWAKGKCGFKALQYMSLGIPAIVSPVGVNVKIVDKNKNGWICDSLEEWENTLRFIFDNPQEVQLKGQNARQKVIDEYSVQSNTVNFLRLFQ